MNFINHNQRQQRVRRFMKIKLFNVIMFYRFCVGFLFVRSSELWRRSTELRCVSGFTSVAFFRRTTCIQAIFCHSFGVLIWRSGCSRRSLLPPFVRLFRSVASFGMLSITDSTSTQHHLTSGSQARYRSWVSISCIRVLRLLQSVGLVLWQGVVDTLDPHSSTLHQYFSVIRTSLVHSERNQDKSFLFLCALRLSPIAIPTIFLIRDQLMWFWSRSFRRNFIFRMRIDDCTKERWMSNA